LTAVKRLHWNKEVEERKYENCFRGFVCTPLRWLWLGIVGFGYMMTIETLSRSEAKEEV
jgi:hypothetical protein